MIIIEGMDNSGKSTLIRQLMKSDSRLKLVASEGPKDYEAMLGRCVNGMLDPCSLFDRYHLFSEWVYGPVLRGHCKFRGQWTELAFMTMLTAPAVIYCRPDDETICMFDNRHQMDGVKANVKILLQRYDRVMSYFKKLCEINGQGACFRYDYRLMETQEVIEFVQQYIDARMKLHDTYQTMAEKMLNETNTI